MPTVQQLQQEHNQLIEEIDAEEKRARDLEQEARDARARRSEKKIRAAEIRQQIGTAANAQAADETRKAADAARHEAEQVAQSLKAKEAALDNALSDVAKMKADLEKRLAE